MAEKVKSPFEAIKPLSLGQERLINALKDKDNEIVGVFGPTGTGKSLIMCSYGIHAVLTGEYKRFIIARPVVEISTGEVLSAAELGELYYKIAAEYLEDIFTGIMSYEDIKKLIDEGKVAIVDVHYVRGRTFDDSIIFLDDAQSVQPEIAAEILMRIGRNSRFLVAGDPVFQKPQHIEKDGATLLRELLLGEENAAVIDLGLKDIARPGARRGIKLALEMRMRKRELSESEKRILDVARVHAPDADIVTVVEFKKEKEEFGISDENVPDALIVAKEGYLGRVVGRGGERIRKIESDTGFKIRAVELTLNLKDIIAAVHPVSWIRKHIADVDFAGPELQVKIKREFGAFVGQKGMYIRFVDRIMRKLINVGVRAVEAEEEEEEERSRRRR